MDSMCISARNEFSTLLKNLVSPKSIKDFFLKVREAIKKHSHGANRVLPLPEEENVDSNSNDSSRVSTSLPKANIAGKCSKIRLKIRLKLRLKLRLPYGFFKDFFLEVREAIKKHSHGANRVLPLPEEENVDSNSNDSSRVSTSLPKANIAGKCSKIRLKLRLKLRLPYGFFKFMNHRVSAEAREKTPHVANSLFQIPVEEEMASPEVGPSMFDFSGVSGWPLPSSSSNSSSLWIVDSGATHHVCFFAASFERGDPIFNSAVFLPNGDRVPVLGTGSVRLCNDLTLQNVLFIPQFHCNLLSISALTQQHRYVVSFHHDHYVIEDPTQGRRIGMGRQVGNLYILDLSNMFFVSL